MRQDHPPGARPRRMDRGHRVGCIELLFGFGPTSQMHREPEDQPVQSRRLSSRNRLPLEAAYRNGDAALTASRGIRETSLYTPVKRFLESRGFEVKGEICGCDLVALRDGQPTISVVGELKLGFNLDLVLQGVHRTAACDEIWLAVRFQRRGRERDPRVLKLCRFLGFGLLGVSTAGHVEVLVQPGAWRPRRDTRAPRGSGR